MRKRKHKIIRYILFYIKKLKHLNRKNISRWFIKNLKTHPFILSIFIFVWISGITGTFFERMTEIGLLKFLLKLHGGLFLAWIILVILSNMLKDKEKVKWFLKKRFVFTMLILFTPLGLILLWSGCRFKKITKITLTVVFCIIFIASQVYHQKKVFKIMHMNTFDGIVEMVERQKGRTYLKQFSNAMLKPIVSVELSAKNKKKTKLAVSDIYKRNALSIVSIVTKDASGKEIGRGSGFVISPDGVIATNAHVLRNAHQAEITAGKQIFNEVFLLKNIAQYDTALLKIDAQGLPYVQIGDSEKLITGQVVVALGNPLGLDQSVSTGVISAIRSNGSMKLIQVTVPLSPGSSGGPLLNEYGEVIGITTLASFFMAQNVNFAIPINYLTQALAEKKKTRK